MVIEKVLEGLAQRVRRQVDEMWDARIANELNGLFMDEVAGRLVLLGLAYVDAPWQRFQRYTGLCEEQDLVLLSRQPVARLRAKHEIDEHDAARDERRAGLPPVPVFVLVDGVVERTAVDVKHVAAVLTEPVASRQPPRD